MNKFYFYLLILFNAVLFSGCSKIEKFKAGTTIAEKTDVKTYEIINLLSTKTLADKYSAKFGTMAVELFKTSDSTLTFFVPNTTDGKHTLDFELAKIDFTVSQSQSLNPEQFLFDYSELFDARIDEIKPVGPEEIAEIDSMKAYKNEVVNLFNSLSAEDKRITTIFYEANKSLFQTFSNNVPTRLNASTTFRAQSDCPRTDFKTFYGCTAENLAKSTTELLSSSKKFLEMMGMATVMAGTALSVTGPLGPVAWGITAVGMSLPLGAAGYFLFAEIRPAFFQFKKSLEPFLYANWVFSETLFETVTADYLTGFSVNMNFNAKFRSILDIDSKINSGAKFFIKAFNALIVNWDKLKRVLGESPFYRSNQEDVTLASNDFTITEISNPNVTLISRQGEKATFKSINGTTESFTYKVKVKKEGFEFEKTLSARVLGEMAEVQIDQQIWTLLNLNVSKYRNGDIIPEVQDSATWANLTTGAWCYHSNSSANGAVYGKLYNWYAVNDPRGLAPAGWHIPNNAEFYTLSDYLGGTSIACNKMKSTSDSYWVPPNDASNSSGFSAMGAGYRSAIGNFGHLGFLTHIWSSNESSANTAAGDAILLRNYEAKIWHPNGGGGGLKNCGFSVRCVKD
jgi:uncharacterized protein (TIGR02145 family)